MVLVLVHRFPNKQNHPHAIHPKRNHPFHAQPAQTVSTVPRAICPNETVGAVPVCPPASPSKGAFVVKIPAHHACIFGMETPLRGRSGGHIGTAPTNPHQTTRYAITSSHCTFDSSRQPHGVFIPHRIAHSIAPNHAVCPYPIGVVLSIAQGWQVQRSLPWVTMQEKRLPPWGLYFFSSHIITTRGERMISRMQIDFKKYNADGIGSPPRLYPG